jgi:hypothetical protein
MKKLPRLLFKRRLKSAIGCGIATRVRNTRRMRRSCATVEERTSCLQTFLEHEHIVSITFLPKRVRLRPDNGQEHKRQKNNKPDATVTRHRGHRHVSRRRLGTTSIIKRESGPAGGGKSEMGWLDQAAKSSCGRPWNEDSQLLCCTWSCWLNHLSSLQQQRAACPLVPANDRNPKHKGREGEISGFHYTIS